MVLLAFYLLVPIGIIMKVLIPNNDILTSIEKSVDFLMYNYTQTKNMTSESELNNISYSFLYYKDEDFKSLNNTKDDFYKCYMINSLTAVILICVDAILAVFVCCGMKYGIEMVKCCCVICIYLGCAEDCLKCFIKAALKCPLFLQFLIGSLNAFSLIFLIVYNNIARTSINNLVKKLNINNNILDFKSNNVFNGLFLAAMLILLILNIVHWGMKCYYGDDSTCNPPKMKIKIYQKKFDNKIYHRDYQTLSIIG